MLQLLPDEPSFWEPSGAYATALKIYLFKMEESDLILAEIFRVFAWCRVTLQGCTLYIHIHDLEEISGGESYFGYNG